MQLYGSIRFHRFFKRVIPLGQSSMKYVTRPQSQSVVGCRNIFAGSIYHNVLWITYSRSDVSALILTVIHYLFKTYRNTQAVLCIQSHLYIIYTDAVPHHFVTDTDKTDTCRQMTELQFMLFFCKTVVFCSLMGLLCVTRKKVRVPILISFIDCQYCIVVRRHQCSSRSIAGSIIISIVRQIFMRHLIGYAACPCIIINSPRGCTSKCRKSRRFICTYPCPKTCLVPKHEKSIHAFLCGVQRYIVIGIHINFYRST